MAQNDQNLNTTISIWSRASLITTFCKSICFPFQLFSKVPLISDILLHFKADRFSWKKPKPCFFVDSDVFIITLINMAGRNVLISWEKHTRAKNFHVNFWRCSVIFTSHKSFQMLIFVQASISESVFHPGMKDF